MGADTGSERLLSSDSGQVFKTVNANPGFAGSSLLRHVVLIIIHGPGNAGIFLQLIIST